MVKKLLPVAIFVILLGFALWRIPSTEGTQRIFGVIAALLLAAGIVLQIINIFATRNAPSSTISGPEELTQEQADALRARREEGGEVRAVRQLRQMHSGLSNDQARAIIKEL